MPQVDHKLRKTRAAILRKIGERKVTEFLTKHLNSRAQIIVEAGGIGRTEHFAPVKLDKELEQGTLAFVQIGTMIENNMLVGQVIEA
jgi:threonylcarbamoyladenosine tRNA methylthiotransferase MtaB